MTERELGIARSLEALAGRGYGWRRRFGSQALLPIDLSIALLRVCAPTVVVCERKLWNFSSRSSVAAPSLLFSLLSTQFAVMPRGCREAVVPGHSRRSAYREWNCVLNVAVGTSGTHGFVALVCGLGGTHGLVAFVCGLGCASSGRSLNGTNFACHDHVQSHLAPCFAHCSPYAVLRRVSM
jgi:hypothetical protein